MEVRPNPTVDNSSIPQQHRQRHAPAAAPLEQAATLPVPVDASSVSKRSISFSVTGHSFTEFSVWFSSKGKKERKKEEAYIPYLNFLYPFSRFLSTQSKDYACLFLVFLDSLSCNSWVWLPGKLGGKENKFQNPVGFWLCVAWLSYMLVFEASSMWLSWFNLMFMYLFCRLQKELMSLMVCFPSLINSCWILELHQSLFHGLK
jgi:hypothetical protein